MSEHNTQTKSMLAKLLATENISFQHSPSAKTAYFDVKNRLLVLPVWQNISNDLYDMLVVHEVGHALDTRADDWMGAIKRICNKAHGKENTRAEMAIKGFLNVVEDARIDKRQKRRYPGARRNYVMGYKELIERDFFGTATKDINSMSFIDRLNLFFKGGALLGVKFSQEEMPFVKRAEAAETWADVEALTEEIYLYSKQKGEENQQFENDIEFGETDESDEYDDDLELDTDDFDLDDADESDEDSNGKIKVNSKSNDADESDETDDGKGNAERGEGDIDEQSDKTGSQKLHGEGASSDEIKDFIPESETERAWEKNVSNIVADDDINYIYVDIPKPIMQNIVDDYKIVLQKTEKYLSQTHSAEWYSAVSEEVNKFKNEENAAISFMVKEFESRKSADIYSKISIAKTGVIDTNKLHSYKFSEDIFRRLSVVPTGKNHGFVMILDWSGSMYGNIKSTLKQLISLTLFCKRVQIPFEVYTFRDVCSTDNYTLNKSFEVTQGTIKFSAFKMCNILSSRMNTAEFNKALVYLWAHNAWRYINPMNGTPLNQAIVAAEYIIKDFQRRNKLQIVNTIFLTDGESNPIDGVNIPASSQYTNKRKGNKYILRDNVCKKEYNIDGNIHGAYEQVTNILLRVLKDRTECNLIGFFLSHDRITYLVPRHYGFSQDPTKLKEFWKANNFIPVKSAGYDEYYIINARNLGVNAEQLAIDPKTMTKNKIAKEFMKYSERKSINRVLLRQFVEKISTKKVKVS